MDYTKVVAPFDGVVTKRYANNGAMIQAGTASHSQAMPVVRLSRESACCAWCCLCRNPPPALVRPGSKVDVRIPSLDKNFRGNVARIADKVDTSTRTMRRRWMSPIATGS